MAEVSISKKSLINSSDLFLQLFHRVDKIWPLMESIELSSRGKMTDKIGPEFFEALSLLSSLKKIQLFFVHMSVLSVISLGELLLSGNLNSLSLYGCYASEYDELGNDWNSRMVLQAESDFLFFTIINAIANKTSLKKINLEYNAISDKYLNEFLYVLQHSSVKNVDLKWNRISTHGVEKISAFCSEHCSTSVLNLAFQRQSILQRTFNDNNASVIHSPNYFQFFNMFKNIHIPVENHQIIHQTLMKAVRVTPEIHTLYSQLSIKLSKFYTGSEGVSSELIDAAINNLVVSCTAHAIQVGEIFFESITAPISICLYFARTILNANARSKQKDWCNHLLSLVTPEHKDYLILVLPAFIAILFAREFSKFINDTSLSEQNKNNRIHEFINVRLTPAILGAWSNTATLNKSRGYRMTNNPEQWLMKLLQYLLDASGSSKVNDQFDQGWFFLTKKSPAVIEKTIESNLQNDTRNII